MEENRDRNYSLGKKTGNQRIDPYAEVRELLAKVSP
jgi:hypothetical protein